MLLILIIAAIFCSALSGIVGMAGGASLLAVMSLFLPVTTLIPVHGVVQLISNSSRTFFLAKDVHRGMGIAFFLGVPIGGLIGYFLLTKIERPEWIILLIAAMLLYVAFKPKKLPEIKIPIKSFFILGIFSATIGCIVGVTGPFIAPFFVRSDLKKESIVATKACCQVGAHLVKIPVFLGLHFNYANHWVLILALSLSVIVGTRLGIGILRKVSRSSFLNLMKAVMVIVAARLILKYFSIF